MAVLDPNSYYDDNNPEPPYDVSVDATLNPNQPGYPPPPPPPPPGPDYSYDPILGGATPTGSPTPGAIGGIDPATAGAAEAGQVDYLAEIGNTGPVTREVADNELVSKQLEGLLDSNSPFIRNARRRAGELANRRGQFGSSLFAGAAERSAIEASLPIAQNDAQAYRDAAYQNLTMLNQNALAQLQRVSNLEVANLGAKTQISIANLDAATRVSMANLDAMTRIDIANLDSETRRNIASMGNETQLRLQEMQSALQLTIQTRNMTHDGAMETMRQDGRLELANIDADLRNKLQEAGFAHDFNLADLNQANRLEAETIINEYTNERQTRDHIAVRTQSHINMAMQAQMNYMNYLSSFAGTEMDSAAAGRLQSQANSWLTSQMDMINGLYPELPAINTAFGPAGG